MLRLRLEGRWRTPQLLLWKIFNSSAVGRKRRGEVWAGAGPLARVEVSCGVERVWLWDCLAPAGRSCFGQGA